MATIYAPTSSVARCSTCGVQRQFHFKSDVPHSADRDHVFVAETIADFEPGDLTPVQLVSEIMFASSQSQKLTNNEPVDDASWEAASRHDVRAGACRTELLARVQTVFGVDFDDLSGALES